VGPKQAFHGLDHDYLFKPTEGRAFAFTLQDRAMERLMSQSLVNFVRRGNPSTREVPWPKANRDNPTHYLRIYGGSGMGSGNGKGLTEIKDMFAFERLKFWLTLLEKYPQYNMIRGMYHEEFLRDEL